MWKAAVHGKVLIFPPKKTLYIQVPIKNYLELVRFTEAYLPCLKMRFTENHDQPRFTESVSSVFLIKSWTCFMSFLPGCFQFYAGQESGEISIYVSFL